MCAVRDLNPRPSRCKRVALPTELTAHAEHFTLNLWAWGDSNSQVLRHTLLRRTRIPVPPHALVPPAGIEPTSTA
jgi:hypothetical protein